MLATAADLEPGAELSADICIVGAGAAGIALALALDGWTGRVLLLEAGGRDYDDGVQDAYRGDQGGLPYHDLDVARLRYFGGSTNHWGGFCVPWTAQDFAPRPDLPMGGWPLAPAEVTPFLPRAMEIVGLGGYGFDAGEWIGADTASPDARLETVVGLRSPHRVFAERYLETLVRSANVLLVLDADVLELEATERADHVLRLHVDGPAGRRVTVAAGTTVLAAGGIENARLLLLSDRVRPGGLGNDDGRGWVGRCFMDHVGVTCGRFLPSRPLPRLLADGDWETASGVGVRPLLVVPPAERQRAGLGRAFVTLPRRYGTPHPSRPGVKALRHLLRRLGEGELPDNTLHHLRLVLADMDDVVGLAWKKVFPGDGGGPQDDGKQDGDTADALALRSIDMSFEPVPDPDSRIVLARETDALGRRRVRLDWRLNPRDVETVRGTLLRLAGAFGRLGLGRVAPELPDAGGNWPVPPVGHYHHMGTTRMADSPARGVVDRDGKVFGIDNLYVAGSSVFATAGSGTPTLLLVALALRLARHLTERPQ